MYTYIKTLESLESGNLDKRLDEHNSSNSFSINSSNVSNNAGKIVRTHISPNKTPLDITKPISVPKVKSMVHKARNPTKVVRDDPTIDLKVLVIALVIASLLPLLCFFCSLVSR